MKHIMVVSYEFLMALVMNLPRYVFFNSIKALFLRCMGAKIGSGVVIYPGVWIVPGRNLVIGNDVDLAKDVLITTSGGVIIGDRTLVGYRTQIISSNHSIPPVGEPFPISGDVHKQVFIAEDVWIGANCVICPGVTIDSGSVIAAGSVVTKDIPKNSIAGGNPATVLSTRV